MKDHQQAKGSIIGNRYKFYTCSRGHNQSITDYVATLRKLAESCEFGDTLKDMLQDMLRDRLVIEVNDERIHRRLLSETTLKQ